MTDENTTQSNSNSNVEQLRNQTAVALANEFLSRATLGEALSQVPLSSVIQLCQSRALDQGREQVKDMNQKEIENLLAEIEQSKAEAEAAQKTAENAVKEVTSETAAASQ